MKKQYLLVLAMLLALGMLFSACPGDPEDDYPPPPVVIEPPPPPDPPPPVDHSPSDEELEGNWSTGFLPTLEDEKLVTFVNRLDNGNRSSTRYGNQMIKIESNRITNMSFDEYLNLKLTISTTMRVYLSSGTTYTYWDSYAKERIIENWPGELSFNPSSGNTGPFVITANEVIENSFTWFQAETLKANITISADGEKLWIKQPELLMLFPRKGDETVGYSAKIRRFDTFAPDYVLEFNKKISTP
jgi:hypothetical protein